MHTCIDGSLRMCHRRNGDCSALDAMHLKAGSVLDCRIKGRFVKAEELHLYRNGLLPGQDGIKPDFIAVTDAGEPVDE